MEAFPIEVMGYLVDIVTPLRKNESEVLLLRALVPNLLSQDTSPAIIGFPHTHRFCSLLHYSFLFRGEADEQLVGFRLLRFLFPFPCPSQG